MPDLSDKDIARLSALASAMKLNVSKAQPSEMPTDITVCMTMFDSIETFALALRSVRRGSQSLPVSLIVCDNGSSDGCQMWAREIATKVQTPVGMSDSVTLSYWKARFPRGIKAIQVPQYDGLPARFPREYYNIRECFRKMWPLVKTPYILMLDADVELPKGALRTMYDMLNADAEIGQAGVLYEEAADHVKHGCSLIRTELAMQVLAKLTINSCMCRQICTQLDELGFRSVYVPSISARHNRDEL